MNWEQVLKNVGASAGLMALMIFWLGQALWMRVDADKRGMLGWAWALAGIVLPVVSLFVFLIIRSRHPVLEVVAERDAIIEETSRLKMPFDLVQNADETTTETATSDDKMSQSVKEALEAEQRRYQNP